MATLSTFTSMSVGGYPLAERSEATPGLWNNIFSVLSTNLDQLNSDVSQFVLLSSVGTAQVIGGISTNTLAPQSGNTLTFSPSVDSLLGTLSVVTIRGSGNTVTVNAALSTNTLAPQSGNTIVATGAVSTNTLAVQSGSTLGVFSILSSTFSLFAPVYDRGGWGVNVKTVGAVADGVTDDTAACAAALTLAYTTSQVVLFPAGNYNIVGTLTITKPLTILGASGATIIHATSVNPALQIQAQSLVDGLAFVGSGLSTAGYRAIVCETGAAFSVVRRCSFTSFREALAAVNNQNVPDLTWEYNSFQSCWDGCLMQSTTNGALIVDRAYIHHNRMNWIVGAGIQYGAEGTASSGRSATIIYNTITSIATGSSSAGGYGIDISGVNSNGSQTVGDVLCGWNYINGGNSGNSFGGQEGIHVESANNVCLIGNHIESMGSTAANPAQANGISMLNSNSSHSNIRIQDNIVKNCYQDGINFGGTSLAPATIITGNFCELNGRSGLNIAGPRAGSIIANNIARNNGTLISATSVQRAGIFIDGAQNCVIANNVCLDDRSTATQLVGLFMQAVGFNAQNFVLVGNLAFGNVLSDISITGSATSWAEIGSMSGLTAYNAAASGAALFPTWTFTSERSLGWYRSAASTMALSYGSLTIPGPIQAGGLLSTTAGGVLVVGSPSGYAGGEVKISNVGASLQYGWSTDGTVLPEMDFDHRGTSNAGWWRWRNGTGASTAQASLGSNGEFVANMSLTAPGSGTTPAHGFSSETSLGLYRSAASTMALSYGTLQLTSGGLTLATAGDRIRIKNGTNASFGTAVLGSVGSVNVPTNIITANSIVFLTDQTAGGTLGQLSVGAKRAGSGFTITSSNIADTSTIAWLVIEPSP